MHSLFRKYAGTLMAAVALIALAGWWLLSRGSDYAPMAGVPAFSEAERLALLSVSDSIRDREPSYITYLADLGSLGAKDAQGASLAVPGAGYKASSASGVRKQSGIGENTDDAAVLNETDSWVEYEIEAPQDGFYQMKLRYYALEGRGSPVQLTMTVDGDYPYRQLKRISFSRMYKEGGPVRQDLSGNEFNPDQQEAFGWQTQDIRDAEGKVAEPLRVYFKQGRHKIRVTSLREPVAIGELLVYAPAAPPPYEQLVKQYKEKGYEETKGVFVKIQAEEAVLKSDPTLRRAEERDAAAEPFDRTRITLNTIGGGNWRDAGQWLEWQFEVPESGLYQIGSRFQARWLKQMPVSRTVYIDGKIPFQEMNAVYFPYSKSWQVSSLGSRDEPYLFYLDKGKHTIRMEVQIGEWGSVFETVEQVSAAISALSRDILMITGTNPDPNYEWELERNIPDLVPRLQAMGASLDGALKRMGELGVESGSPELESLASARDDLLDMSRKTETIPERLDSLSNMQSAIGKWINDLSKQRLQLDYLIVKSSDASWPKAEASWLAKAGNGTYDFVTSFTKDYRKIGDTGGGQGKELNVWVARGRDWVQIIKSLADNDFTAKTGIKVNVSLIPPGSMNLFILAITSGNVPDAALGLTSSLPIDFALRGALQDLSAFPDYKEVANRFRPGALIPFGYKGGSYALPENQDFSMLFYRKDIMRQLGVEKIPETWEEVFDLIPLLQQKGMDFYYPNDSVESAGQFAPFLFQNGGEFYRDGGKTTSLDTPEALEAMEMWTGLFTNYKISREANFYNRFRTGEMPIGVSGFSTYLQLSTTAPELTGWWEMKPMPGIRQKDGKIDRSTGGTGQTAVLFKDSAMKEEAWEFLKWWTSAPVQLQFGEELEALMGAEARWNTANIEALGNSKWPQHDIDAVLNQWEWFKEREIVPGYYLMDRTIPNIWNEIVLNGKSVREALEVGVKQINKELALKRKEFGLDQADQTAESKGGGG